MNSIKIFFIVLIILFFSFNAKSFSNKNLNYKSCSSINDNPFKIDDKAFKWIDSVYNSLSPEERIAQLLMIRAYSNNGQEYNNNLKTIVKKYNIGGLAFFQGGPVRQAVLTNKLQTVAKTPLLISIDAEWGLGMRLDSTISFPHQMTLGAIQNNRIIYEMGKEIARQCKRIGIHINFAPVVDVNSNPKNPVINSRSFGELKVKVSEKGIEYMNGLQSEGIIACAKHFPGHGDTDSDSHYTLPIINKNKEILYDTHIFPFKELIDKGLMSVMVAHLYVPSLDSSINTATTLSKKVVYDVLRKELKFKGLIITDALDMQGVTNHFKAGEIEVRAFLAGNDILLLPTNIPVAISEINKAVNSGIISEKDLERRCKKILLYKYLAGLSKTKKIEIANIERDLNNSVAKFINYKLYESAITLVKNNDNIIPLKDLETKKLASVSIGYSTESPFQHSMANYSELDSYSLSGNATYESITALVGKLMKYDLVIVGVHKTSNSPSKNFGISQRTIDFINILKKKKKIILDLFANPYALGRFTDTENIEAILVSYQDNEIAENISAQAIFGGIGLMGKLPVSASSKFPVKSGIYTDKIRLQYSMPENNKIRSSRLDKVDSIVMDGIKMKAYPGCQVIIAQNGNVIYNKSFGNHTYNKKLKVKNTDLYDLASLTKILATTICIMKLYDEGKIDIDQKLVKYLPSLKGTNKENIIIRDMMAHQAKLKPWIPFYTETMTAKGKLNSKIYSEKISKKYPIEVAEGIYIKKEYTDTIFQRIIDSGLRKKTRYRYSDLGFYLLKEIVEKVSKQGFEEYLYENFYSPLGLSTICFKPMKKFEKRKIIPTENDTVFRKQLVHGYVHDQGAAMLGGVSGHAGLFANSNAVAVIMQMLVQYGEYGGKRYIKESTVKQFAKQQFPINKNRRGIGFDKPLTPYKGGPACKKASVKSFGHSGFTGTYTWADPEKKLVYVFLSNRINPSAENRKLIERNIRTRIQAVIYDALPKL